MDDAAGAAAGVGLTIGIALRTMGERPGSDPGTTLPPPTWAQAASPLAATAAQTSDKACFIRDASMLRRREPPCEIPPA